MDAVIRPAEVRDSVAIAAIYRPFVETSHISFEEVPPEPQQMSARMANPIYPWLVIDEGDKLLGYASAAPMRDRAAYRWSVETGIYFAPEARGRGLGRRLLETQLDLLERQGFVTAVAGIALPNEASVALHKKVGFVLLGIERGVGFKRGKWVDVGRLQRDLAPRAGNPREPIPYAAISPS
ncbi:MAG TPA: GNAT family N-acetyltransferase [Sphingomicrobium sp.]|nr:GNAT family N-acetyltransferase [Sphingomicrobium sp.]